MFQRRVLPYLGLMIVMVSVPALAAEKARELSEKQKIEALIRAVSNVKNARFIRKDTDVDCISAAEFLRAKATYSADQIFTVQDFIDVCSSSPDGVPYQLQFAEGTVPLASFLKFQLASIA